VKDEGLNPTGTFKVRGMAVAVPMARALGASTLVVPTAGNAGAALALYAATYGLQAIVLLARDGSEEAIREAIAFGAHVLQVPLDIAEAGRIASELASTAEAFSVATLREPYRVEGKKTMLFEIWESLGGLPDWIVIPTGGGTGVVGMWKALYELRDLGWYDGPWPRFAVVQAEGCAPLVKAWKEGRDSADRWPDPRTEAAGLRVPATIGDRLVLRAIRETRGAAVAVSDEAMQVASQNLASFEGISACLEGAATLAGFRRLYDEGLIVPEDHVVLMNTGCRRGMGLASSAVPTVRSAEEARSSLGLTSRAP
jgi:threonine synthase